jgi:hypothetical protein
MIVGDGFKIVLGTQSPDWWYGPYSPNCTDDIGTHSAKANCQDGCLYNIFSDVGEHVNLRGVNSSMEDKYQTLLAIFQKTARTPSSGSGSVKDVGDSESDACAAMRTKHGGFFGPWQ